MEGYGADPQRIRAIPNGCDASLFHPGDRAAARAGLGLPEDAEIVLYVGRLVAEKGLRELLQATRRLATARPRARVVLVGEGPLQGRDSRAMPPNRRCRCTWPAPRHRPRWRAGWSPPIW